VKHAVVIFSTLAFLAFLTGVGVWVYVGPFKHFIPFHLRRHTMQLEGGQQISATSGYTIEADRTWLTVYEIELTPVVCGSGKGPNGLPVAALFHPTVTATVHIHIGWIVAGCLSSATIPGLWHFQRSHP
jgi:hypothetical protein